MTPSPGLPSTKILADHEVSHPGRIVFDIDDDELVVEAFREVLLHDASRLESAALVLEPLPILDDGKDGEGRVCPIHRHDIAATRLRTISPSRCGSSAYSL
ncbi:MAG: hypothetical protein WBW74_02410 [Xanthobacteraceae bacterium]